MPPIYLSCKTNNRKNTIIKTNDNNDNNDNNNNNNDNNNDSDIQLIQLILHVHEIHTAITCFLRFFGTRAFRVHHSLQSYLSFFNVVANINT